MLNMAASFDPVLAGEWGSAMGDEFWNKGTNIQEGPGINIARIDRNGRTFEYISGEDPVLGSMLVQVFSLIHLDQPSPSLHHPGDPLPPSPFSP